MPGVSVTFPEELFFADLDEVEAAAVVTFGFFVPWLLPDEELFPDELPAELPEELFPEEVFPVVLFTFDGTYLCVVSPTSSVRPVPAAEGAA